MGWEGGWLPFHYFWFSKMEIEFSASNSKNTVQTFWNPCFHMTIGWGKKHLRYMAFYIGSSKSLPQIMPHVYMIQCLHQVILDVNYSCFCLTQGAFRNSITIYCYWSVSFTFIQRQGAAKTIINLRKSYPLPDYNVNSLCS